MLIERERYLDDGAGWHISIALQSRSLPMHSLLTALTIEERAAGKEAIADIVAGWQERMELRTYSLVGVRPEVDFMFWKLTERYDDLRELAVDVNASPIAGYLETLERIAELAPRVVLPGHGEPVEDPAGRARETAAHHRARLDEAAAALAPEPRTAAEVSREIWPGDLDPAGRSLAVAEALAHLERLVREGRARGVHGPDGRRRFSPRP